MFHQGVLEVQLHDANEVERLRQRLAELEILYDYSIQERQRLELQYLNEVDINLRLEDDVRRCKKLCMK